MSSSKSGSFCHSTERIAYPNTSARLCVGINTLKRGAILEAAIACQAVGDQGRVQWQPIFVGIGVIVRARRKVYDDTVPLTDIDVGVPNKSGNSDQSPVVLKTGSLSVLFSKMSGAP